MDCETPRVGMTLIRQEMAHQDLERYGAFRIRFEVSDPLNLPAEVFLYERRLLDPYTGTYGEVCLGVCSVVDLYDYPVGAPDPDAPYPFYRKSFADYFFRSISDAEYARRTIPDHLKSLVQAVKATACLAEPEQIRIGDFDE